MIALVETFKTLFMVIGIFNVVCMVSFAGLIWWDNRGQVRR